MMDAQKMKTSVRSGSLRFDVIMCISGSSSIHDIYNDGPIA